jgi:hypothetical protein
MNVASFASARSVSIETMNAKWRPVMIRGALGQPGRMLAAAVLGMATFVAIHLGGCEAPKEQKNSVLEHQRTFKTPETAVEALAQAARSGDEDELMAIFGPEGREVLASGDPVADKSNRGVFAVALDQQWALEPIDSKTRELIVGHEQWPFPIPLVKESSHWRFDTAAGKLEVLARRIGRNELAAIAISRTYVIAQKEYASQGRDGKPAGIYAQKVHSEPERHDGLYWAMSSPDEERSPLGELAAQAEAEGYTTAAPKQPRPFHGYFFRILSEQGDDAPGGAKSYIVNGEMRQGFALIAYPAEYGNSGIMTFIVNQDAIVHEADLGEDTLSVAGQIQAYNPDASWRAIE